MQSIQNNNQDTRLLEKLAVRYAAYGVLIRDRSVLLCEAEIEGVSVINFPGGELENGEDSASALIREVSEELGIESRIGELLYLSDDQIFLATTIPNCRLSNSYFVIESSAPEIELCGNGDDVAKLRWVPLSDLPLKNMMEVDRVFCEKLRVWYEESR